MHFFHFQPHDLMHFAFFIIFLMVFFLCVKEIFMLKRKLYNVLLDWKKEKREKALKEALLLKGARQVGKSYLIEEEFSKTYKSFIKINFIERPELKKAFIGTRNPAEIYSNLSIYMPEMKLVPGDTLFFLDEIQNCGDARTAIKFLASDLRFDFIASGSLLGLEYGEDADDNVEVPESIPVGFERPITMFSLDFEEYLWAKGYTDEHINQLRSYFENLEVVPAAINDKFERLFREYMVVGGMPEAVAAYIVQNDFNEAIRVQDKIIHDYKEDIAKHAKGEQKIKVKACYESVPKQLARELGKFQYSFVEKGKTSRKYGGSVKWLKDSALVNACYNISEPYLPLMANEKEEQFKLYINDTGLLTDMYGRETKIAILNDTIKGHAKGAVYENIISELLVKNGYNLHYFRPDDNHELEFIIEKESAVVPIEVKAGNTSSTSLNRFVEKYRPPVAYKMIKGNVGIIDGKTTIPHYFVMFI